MHDAVQCHIFVWLQQHHTPQSTSAAHMQLSTSWCWDDLVAATLCLPTYPALLPDLESAVLTWQ